MQDIGKVRVRVPSSIKAGDVVRVRTLVIHPMERIERDTKGQIIQKKYNTTEEDAYFRLRNQSRRLRRSMRELAEAVILAEDIQNP